LPGLRHAGRRRQAGLQLAQGANSHGTSGIALRKNLNIEHGGRVVAVAWISFQPDGSISFGLRDRTFVLESARIRSNLWNAYNRVGIRYVAPNVTDPLLPVDNPHFTFHPPIQFHLKSNSQLKSQDEEIFSGIADVGITLSQQNEMPWIRATSAPLGQLKQSPSRADGIETEALTVQIPAIFNEPSVAVEIDFVRPADVRIGLSGPVWEIVWHDVGVRILVKGVVRQIATLAWFHFA
jgi:hypothetical protein